MNWTREYERATCPICGRRISAWVPHFGDGSDVKLVRHNVYPRAAGTRCAGSDRMLGELREELRVRVARGVEALLRSSSTGGGR